MSVIPSTTANRLLLQNIATPLRVRFMRFHLSFGLEVWPESHWPGFALREADVFKTYMAWWCM